MFSLKDSPCGSQRSLKVAQDVHVFSYRACLSCTTSIVSVRSTRLGWQNRNIVWSITTNGVSENISKIFYTLLCTIQQRLQVYILHKWTVALIRKREEKKISRKLTKTLTTVGSFFVDDWGLRSLTVDVMIDQRFRALYTNRNYQTDDDKSRLLRLRYNMIMMMDFPCMDIICQRYEPSTCRWKTVKEWKFYGTS